MSADRAGDGLGVDRQREDCRTLAARRDMTIVAEFAENDTSAAGRKPRPQFRKLLAAIAAGQLEVVIAWSLDRLTRTARDRLALIEACRDAGVVIALVQGSDMDPTSAAGRLAIGILGEVAQHEIDMKSERQRRAVEQAAQQGRWVGGRRAFGYAPNGVDIVPGEAAAVREGYSALLAGSSLRSIASAWNAAGFTTGQSPWKHRDRGEFSPWRADSVRRVLLNPRYAGLRSLMRDGTRVIIGPSEWEGLVGEDTYSAAKTLLQDANRRTAGTGARQLLTGIATCALEQGTWHECGLPVHGGGAKHGKPIYRCRSTAMQAEARPTVPGTHVNRLAEPVDEYVGDVIVARLSRPDARELLVDHRRADVPALRDELRVLRGRLEGLHAEWGALAADWKATPPTPAEQAAQRRPLETRIAEAEARIADAARVDVLGPLVGADDVALAWKGTPVERQRAVIDLLAVVRLHAVGRGVRTFRRETVEIEWRRQ